MTVRKRLFYNSLLLIIIPSLTIMLLAILYIIILKTELFPNAQRGTKVLQSMQTVNTIMDDYSREELAADNVKQLDLLDRLREKGYQIEIKLNDQVVVSSFLNENSEYAAIYNTVRQEEIKPAIWMRENGHEFYLENSKVSGGELGIIIARTENSELFQFLDFNSITKIFISMIIFLMLSVIVVVLFSMMLSNKLVKRITDPLSLLTKGAMRIREGDYSEIIPQLKELEFVQLAETMNQMQENLKTSCELNERYEQNRREMLAGISHDLRTPLTSIKSYVQGLKDGVATTPEKYMHYLDVIARKTNDMEGLIQSLFLVSKMETGSYTYSLQSIEMKQFLATTLDSISSDFHEEQMELIYRYNLEQEIWAKIDLTEFPRAIRNILHNSVKYNRGKKIEEIVTLEVVDKNIVISIRDNGVGVRGEELDLLFNTFYRTDPSRNNPAEGHGLGLAIVKNIIEGHGGTVRAESKDGLQIVIQIPIWEKEKNL